VLRVRGDTSVSPVALAAGVLVAAVPIALVLWALAA
jgi:hypothetical protein